MSLDPERAELAETLAADPEGTLAAYESLLLEIEGLKEIVLLGPSEVKEYQCALEAVLRACADAGILESLGAGTRALCADLLKGHTLSGDLLRIRPEPS